MKKKKKKQSTYLIRTVNCSCSKILIITIKIIIMILILLITITIIIKCRGRPRILTTTNPELPVTLYNGRKPLTNVTKSSTSDAAWVLYAAYSALKDTHWEKGRSNKDPALAKSTNMGIKVLATSDPSFSYTRSLQPLYKRFLN